MGGMEKTTVYLTDDLKAALRRSARSTGRSEAELIREGIGLKNTRSRLKTLYGDDHFLDISTNENEHGVEITIVVPFRTTLYG